MSKKAVPMVFTIIVLATPSISIVHCRPLCTASDADKIVCPHLESTYETVANPVDRAAVTDLHGAAPLPLGTVLGKTARLDVLSYVACP